MYRRRHLCPVQLHREAVESCEAKPRLPYVGCKANMHAKTSAGRLSCELLDVQDMQCIAEPAIYCVAHSCAQGAVFNVAIVV